MSLSVLQQTVLNTIFTVSSKDGYFSIDELSKTLTGKGTEVCQQELFTTISLLKGSEVIDCTQVDGSIFEYKLLKKEYAIAN